MASIIEQIGKRTNQNNQIINKLVSDNCLSFGRNPKFLTKFTSQKITHYISGKRQKVDIFNLYEMRYLLLKVYPLIHNLFLQQRLNAKKKKKFLFEKSENFPNFSKKLPKQLQKWEDFRNFKTKFNKPILRSIRPFLPKILFATTTELYSSIISSAAFKCHMPFHVNRWLSGTITAAASYLDDFDKWSFLTNDFHEDITDSIQEKFLKRKKKNTQQKRKLIQYQLGRKPSLIIIPDVSNNEMIVKETNAFGIPVLGILSSSCNIEIAYPIFANDLSVYSIHFFCHFISSLITKEIFKNQQKLSISTKKKKSIKFQHAIKQIFAFRKRVSKFKNLKLYKMKKKQSQIPSFFKGGYFLDSFLKPRIKIKKKIKYAKVKYTKFIYTKRKSAKWKKRTYYRHIQKKTKKSCTSPKKLILVEEQKRFGRKKLYYLRTSVLKRINLIKKLHHFDVSKTVRQIRIPSNKPRFRFWNLIKFFFSNSLQFGANTSLAFKFRRYVFPKLLRKQSRKYNQNSNQKYYRKNYNQKIYMRNYRKKFIKKTAYGKPRK